MARPYSVDLRERVLQAHEASEGSQRGLAERFAVSVGTVCGWLGLARCEGRRSLRSGLFRQASLKISGILDVIRDTAGHLLELRPKGRDRVGFHTQRCKPLGRQCAYVAVLKKQDLAERIPSFASQFRKTLVPLV